MAVPSTYRCGKCCARKVLTTSCHLDAFRDGVKIKLSVIRGGSQCCPPSQPSCGVGPPCSASSRISYFFQHFEVLLEIFLKNFSLKSLHTFFYRSILDNKIPEGLVVKIACFCIILFCTSTSNGRICYSHMKGSSQKQNQRVVWCVSIGYEVFIMFPLWRLNGRYHGVLYL
ncbi:hypothetical protein ANCCEY_08283 [Ancylostoma ceylanicum]|uniref:Uncharacterized protein n=1 Tax=Ancylostoma ceylanicum TaxID=53326 RepID=A0A0D6LN57_9BILA|nr:hypothetical protein ANCCEY_08283 [Ancylostoma ceylanicum]